MIGIARKGRIGAFVTAAATGLGTLTLAGGTAAGTSVAQNSAPVLKLTPAIHIGPAHTTKASSTKAAAAAACWQSSNWSGYAVSTNTVSGLPCVPASGKTYTSVTGTWKVPAVSRTAGASYSAAWAGIDGFTNSDLIQAGTEQDYYNGAAHYDAWWEILPAAETVIPSVAVAPGNSITVSITKLTGSSWTISLKNNTTGTSFTTVQSYSGPGTSAEWIFEAPQVNGRIATLAHYGSTVLDPGTADATSPGLQAGTGGEIEQGYFWFTQVVSIPSQPDSDADGFAVAYGSTEPASPAS